LINGRAIDVYYVGFQINWFDVLGWSFCCLLMVV
jgi:hypothetical protein